MTVGSGGAIVAMSEPDEVFIVIFVLDLFCFVAFYMFCLVLIFYLFSFSDSLLFSY